MKFRCCCLALVVCTVKCSEVLAHIELPKKSEGKQSILFYNQSLEEGIVPDIWKLSKITPVDKGGDITDPTNNSVFTQVF